MDLSMDSIYIEIESESKKAVDAIQTLIDKLDGLQTALGNVGKANGFKNLANNIKNAADSTPKTRTSNQSGLIGASLEEQLKNANVSLDSAKTLQEIRRETKDTITEFTKYKTTLDEIVTVEKKMKGEAESYKTTVKRVGEVGKTALDQIKDSATGIITRFKTVVGNTISLARSMGNLTQVSAEFTESANLFFTEMGDNAENAYKWVNKISTALYLDPSDVMQYLGSFNSLTTGLGVGADKAYLMSKNLTQLSYDLASYRNISVEQSQSRLSSAIAGQIKGLQLMGIALNQNTLQETLNAMGIDKKVRSLSQAQLAELRYIQIMNNTRNAQADLGKTLMSTENIIKIGAQQLELFKRALGNIGAVLTRAVLPYFVAFTQLLTEAAQKLAVFFGFDMDFSTYKTASKTISAGVEEIGDAADSTKNKLNTMLAPFDDLNVVQNKSQSAASGISNLGGDTLGVDLPEYDMLSKYSEEFADKIDAIKKKIKDLLPIIKTAAAAMAGIWVIGKLAKFINNIKTVASLFKGLISPITKNNSVFKTLISRFSDGYNYAKALGGKGLPAILSGTRNLLSPIGKLGVTVAGMVASFATGYTSMKNYAEGTESLASSLTKTTAVTTAFGVAAFALVGWPAALAVGIAGLTGALLGYDKGLQELEVHNAVFNNQGVAISKLSEAMSASFESQSSGIKKYASTIEGLADNYINAKSNVDNARTSVDEFMASLDLQDGKVSSSQLNELSEKYKQLKKSTQEAYTANDNYFTALMNANSKATKSSNERTAQEIANYKKISSAMEGMEIEYLNAEEALNKKYYSGKMSTEEYQKALENLKIEYGYATSNTLDGAKAVDIFNDSLDKIDFEGVKQTDAAIKTAKDSMTEQIKVLEEYKTKTQEANNKANEGYQKQIENLEYTKKYGKIWTEEQEKHLNTLRGYVESNNETTKKSVAQADAAIREIQGSYKGYVEGIYAYLVKESADTSKEFSGTIKTLKDEIGSLNKVDASGAGKQIKETLIAGIINNKPEMVIKVRGALQDVGATASNALNEEFKKQLEANKPGLMKDAEEKLGGAAAKGAADGLKNGVDKNKSTIQDAGKNLGNNLILGSRQSLNWNSPSKVYEACGGDVVQGLVNGLNNNKNKPVEAMNNIINSMIKETKKLTSAFTITFDTSKFVNSLDSLLGKLQTFSNKFKSGVNSLLSTFTTTMNGIKVGSDNKLYYTKMPNVTIPRFEQGGYPDKASLFWANEEGIPEMVGRIGNRTAVANNDQITTSITNALVSAFSDINMGNNGKTVVYIGNKKVYEGMGEHIDDENERYGTTYINI